jgi:hypothetical protein
MWGVNRRGLGSPQSPGGLEETLEETLEKAVEKWCA